QQVGAAVALDALGYKVDIKSPGTVILAVDPNGPAAGKLRPRDIVVTVDGKPVPSLTDLRRTIRRHKPGDHVALTVRRGKSERKVEIKTIADKKTPTRPIIGVLTTCTLQRFT